MKIINCKDTGEVCKSYRDYLLSEHWTRVKHRFYKSKLPQRCYICDTKKNRNVHHKTYKNIGNERLMDLMILCEKCHKMTHSYLIASPSSRNNVWNAAKRLKHLIRL